MAGHLGAEQVTVRNLEVLESNAARGLLIVAGAVPGARDGLIKIRYAKKTLEVARTRKPAEAKAAEEEATEEQETAEAVAEEPAAQAEDATAEAPAGEEAS